MVAANNSAGRVVLHAAIAILVGAGGWGITEAILGGEPWNYIWYWVVVYPLMLLLSLILGWRTDRAPWIWGLVIGLAQCSWALHDLHGQAVVLPITIALFLVLSVPFMLAGLLGALIHRKSSKQKPVA